MLLRSFAEHRPAGLLERDQNTVQGHASDEVLGAVNRVDDPSTWRFGARGAELLADDAIGGETGLDQRSTQLLGIAVGLCHRCRIRL